MKNTVKAGLYAAAGSTLLALNTASVVAFSIDDSKNVTKGDNNKGNSFIDTLDNLLGYLIGLLYFIAVALALYGGFQILTAAGDEDKVKGGKTTLINAVIGLVVIFLASQIVTWAMSIGQSTTSGV